MFSCFPQSHYVNSFGVKLAAMAYVPPFKPIFSNFRVELQRQSEVIDSKCLICIKMRACQMNGSNREIKRISMPVKDFHTRNQHMTEPGWRGKPSQRVQCAPTAIL